jgi:NAD(P)-dependent dehydrogenase (short-subunit alcohol dehydrogenase family)
MKDFAGKTAVITGAAEGIGKAIASRAAEEGMKLVLADINAELLDATVREFAGKGATAIGRRVDVAKEGEVDALADAAFAAFGNVHLLVNNAGVALGKPAWETSQRDWDWVMGVNLYGVTNGLRAFVPRMIERAEEGHIVNTASIAGMLSVPGLAAYNASKFAVVTVSEGLHHDLALRHARIGVSVLCPGWVKTRITLSERNRPPAERTDVKTLDARTIKTAEAVHRAVESGKSPREVADAVFAAVGNGDFYIITHADSLPGIKVRMTDILENRQPTLLRI